MADKLDFFPMYMDIRNKKVLFVGGGRIAARRVNTMSQFSCDITVVSPEINEQLQLLSDRGEIHWLCGKYTPQILTEYNMVLACSDDDGVNHDIYQRCKALGIPVNNCSNKMECDFYFPGVVIRENTVIAVNAGGNNHAKAADLRRKIQKLLAEENDNDRE